jgi:hypothetical protein
VRLDDPVEILLGRGLAAGVVEVRAPSGVEPDRCMPVLPYASMSKQIKGNWCPGLKAPESA